MADRVQEQAFVRNIRNQTELLLGGGTDPDKYFPLYSTGARSFITVNGRPVAVCMSMSYSIRIDAEEVRTIDSHLPWDIHVNQISISATLRRLVNPEKSQESDGLFHTIQSALHSPMVEMLVQDASGTTLFFTRGIFNGRDAQMSLGQMTINTLSFQGSLYQGNVAQKFKPYSEDGFLKNLGKFKKEAGKILGKFGI